MKTIIWWWQYTVFDKILRKGLFSLIISMSTLYMKLAFGLVKTRPMGLCLCCHLIKLFSLWNSQERAALQMWKYFGCLNFLVACYLSYTVMCVCPENNCNFLVQMSQSDPFLTAEIWMALQQAMGFSVSLLVLLWTQSMTSFTSLSFDFKNVILKISDYVA